MQARPSGNLTIRSARQIFEAAATTVEDELSQATFVDAVQPLGDIVAVG